MIEKLLVQSHDPFFWACHNEMVRTVGYIAVDSDDIAAYMAGGEL